jgi:hypothetical protein
VMPSQTAAHECSTALLPRLVRQRDAPAYLGPVEAASESMA